MQSNLIPAKNLKQNLPNPTNRSSISVRNTKGMSVSLSIDALPDFRKPPAFGGIGRDPLWQIDSDKITGDLEAVRDSDTHVSITPKVTMLLAQYEAALASTSDTWELV